MFHYYDNKEDIEEVDCNYDKTVALLIGWISIYEKNEKRDRLEFPKKEMLLIDDDDDDHWRRSSVAVAN